MNENLRSDLQQCLDLLGKNDLEANNLSNKIYEIENTSDNINSDLNYVQNFADEFIQKTTKNYVLPEKVEAFNFVLTRLKKRIEELSSNTLTQNTNNILRKNHEVFFRIAKNLEDR